MVGIINSFSRVHSTRFDEAIRHYAENARSMRNDTFLTALHLERTRPLTGWKWEVVLDEDNPRGSKEDPTAEELRQAAEGLIRRTHRFHEMREYLTEYLWYGRYGSQVLYGDDMVGGYRRKIIIAHEPVDGDNILPTFDGYPAIAVNPTDRQYYLDRFGEDSVTYSDRFSVLKLNRRDLRQRFVIQRHHIRAGDYFWPETGGRIGGYGLRHQVYWTWFLRQQMLESVTNFMDKVGTLGLLIFYYEEGNADSEAKAKQAAIDANTRNAISCPVPKGKDPKTAGIDIIPANMNGVQFLVEFIERYFERHIERLFVGQAASASSEGDSLGGNSADFQRNTKFQLLRSDAEATACGFTEDLLNPLMRENFPHIPWRYRFRFVLPDPDAAKKLEAASKAYAMGVSFDMGEVRELTGLSKPDDGTEILQQPQPGPMGGPPGMPGMGGPDGAPVPNVGPQPTGGAAQPQNGGAAPQLGASVPGAAEPQNAPPTDGMAELVAAMVQAGAEGDTDSMRTLAELGSDPDALAGFLDDGDEPTTKQSGNVPDKLAEALAAGGDDEVFEATLLAAIGSGQTVDLAIETATRASRASRQSGSKPTVNYSAVFNEQDHPRASDGKFSSGGGGGGGAGAGSSGASGGQASKPGAEPARQGDQSAKTSDKPGFIGRVRKYGQAALDTKVGRTVLELEHKLGIAAHKTREIAEQAAQKRGLPPEKTERLKKWLTYLDFGGAWVAGGVATAVAGPLAGKVASLTLPTASALYLAYSTAVNPQATWEAAKKAVAEISVNPKTAARDVATAWKGGAVNHASFAGVVDYQWTAAQTKGGGVKAVWSGDGQRRSLYGDAARRALSNQGKQDRGEPPTQTPQQRAAELKQQREPGRDEARQSWRAAIQNPASVRPEQLNELADQLSRLTRDELRGIAREMQQRVGGLKMDLVQRLRTYAASQGAGAATPEEKLVSQPTDLFGRPLPKSNPKAKAGTQLTMDDSVRDMWHQKAEEFASDKGMKVGRRGFGGQFEAGGQWYQVGKAEDGYPISEIEQPKLTGDRNNTTNTPTPKAATIATPQQPTATPPGAAEPQNKPVPPKAKKTQPSREKSDSLAQFVLKEYGGINPNDHALKTVYKNMAEAIENGIPMAVFRKAQKSGLDVIAQQLQSSGIITVPENRHSHEYLLELMAKGVDAGIEDQSKKYEAALLDHYRTLSEAQNDTTISEPEIAEALRRSESDARREVTSAILAEYGIELEDADRGDEAAGGSTDFEFGANESIDSGESDPHR